MMIDYNNYASKMHKIEEKVIEDRWNIILSKVDLNELELLSTIKHCNYIPFPMSIIKMKDEYYDYYSSNINLTIDIVINNPGPWNWYNISANPAIKFEDILKNVNLPWEWDGLGVNPNISYEDFKNNPGPWKWGKNILPEISNYISKYNRLINNSNSNLDDFFNLYYNYKYEKIDWEEIFTKITVTFKELEKYLYFYKNIIESNAYEICENKGIKLEDYSKLKKYNLYRETFANNPNIMLDDILKHPEIEWEPYNLNLNPNITFKDLLEHPEIELDPLWISLNPNITPEILRKYPHYDWNYNSQGLSENPSITFDYVIDNIDKNWNWINLIHNPSLFKIRSTDPDFQTAVREYFAARKIQRQWHRAITNPERAMCRQRLQREFNELHTAQNTD